MPDPVVELTEVLSDALGASMFRPSGATVVHERYSPGEIRQLHAAAIGGRIHYPTFHLYRMDARTEAAKQAALVDVLRDQLALIINGTGQVTLLEEKMTPDDLAQATLRAAAIVNAEEAATQLHRWISGGPWIETLNFTLTGVTVSEPVNIRPGAGFRRLPEQPRHVFGHVPNTMALAVQRGPALQRGGLLGATVLSFEERYRPALRNATEKPRCDVESTFPGGFRTMFGPFLRALSLTCNTPVVHQYSWRTSPPVQQAVYLRGAEGWGLPPAEHWPEDAAVELDGPIVERALRLAGKLQTITESERVGRVFERWMNSLRRQHHVGDQLIEIRVALESLYAAGGTHETSLRVAYHGARHLGRNLQERRTLYRDLKDIYNTASTVIHGGRPKPKKATDLVKRANAIIRDALLKVLEDGEIPDWTDVMLDDR